MMDRPQLLSVWTCMVMLATSPVWAHSPSPLFSDVLYLVNECVSAEDGQFIFPDAADVGTTAQRLDRMLQESCSAFPRVLTCIRQSPVIVGEHKELLLAEVNKVYGICDTEGYIRKVGIPRVGEVTADCLHAMLVETDSTHIISRLGSGYNETDSTHIISRLGSGYNETDSTHIISRLGSGYNENTTWSAAFTNIRNDWILFFKIIKMHMADKAVGMPECSSSRFQDMFFVYIIQYMTRRVVPGFYFSPEQIAVLSAHDMRRRSFEWL